MLDTRQARVTVDGQALSLTSHEFKVLAVLMQRAGEVVSRAELNEHIYAQDQDRDSNTIEVFIGRLRKKLPPDTIETVRGLGIGWRGRNELRARPARCAGACWRARWPGSLATVALAGWGLGNLFRQHVAEQLRAELVLHLNQLTAAVNVAPDALSVTPLSDPGWAAAVRLYWQIDRLDDQGRTVMPGPRARGRCGTRRWPCPTGRSMAPTTSPVPSGIGSRR